MPNIVRSRVLSCRGVKIRKPFCIAGDSAKLELFLTLLDYFTFGFEIVLP